MILDPKSLKTEDWLALRVSRVRESTFTAWDSLGMKLPENSLRVGPACQLHNGEVLKPPWLLHRDPPSCLRLCQTAHFFIADVWELGNVQKKSPSTHKAS